MQRSSPATTRASEALGSLGMLLAPWGHPGHGAMSTHLRHLRHLRSPLPSRLKLPLQFCVRSNLQLAFERMKKLERLGEARTPDGTVLALFRHDGDYPIRADGAELMSTRHHHSEDALAELACSPF